MMRSISSDGVGRLASAAMRIALVGVALAAALVAACGSPPDEETPAARPPTVPPGATYFEIGNDIGDRIPEFGITLTDGAPVTAEGLFADERPTFLFFFGTT